jgi:hypothetical protein
MAIASVLGTLTALKELDLGSNRIGKAECNVLSAIARKNKTLWMRLEDQYEEEGELEDEIDDADDESDEEGFEDFWQQNMGGLQQLLGLPGGAPGDQDFDDSDDYDSLHNDGDDDSLDDEDMSDDSGGVM